LSFEISFVKEQEDRRGGGKKVLMPFGQKRGVK
jgi:hypothetical protein